MFLLFWPVHPVIMKRKLYNQNVLHSHTMCSDFPPEFYFSVKTSDLWSWIRSLASVCGYRISLALRVKPCQLAVKWLEEQIITASVSTAWAVQHVIDIRYITNHALESIKNMLFWFDVCCWTGSMFFLSSEDLLQLANAHLYVFIKLTTQWFSCDAMH